MHFTGKMRDAESNLDASFASRMGWRDDFDARYYSSQWGRFMIPDWDAKPTAVPYASFGNPQSLNLYSYVKNNPTTSKDPDGHSDVGTFQNQCMHNDACRTAQFKYEEEHPARAILQTPLMMGAVMAAAIFGPEAATMAAVRFAPLLTAGGATLAKATTYLTHKKSCGRI